MQMESNQEVTKKQWLGKDHLNFWGGGAGLFLVRPSFSFLLPENQDIFFRQVEDRIFFFGQSESRVFFLITI